MRRWGLPVSRGVDGDNQPAQFSSVRRLPLHPQPKLLHHFHHRLEPLPILGQFVLHLDRRRGVDRALDQARFLQRAKVQGEGALGDAGHVAAQVVEAAGAVDEVGGDEQPPAAAQQAHGFFHGAAGDVGFHSTFIIGRRQVYFFNLWAVLLPSSRLFPGA